jgi:hypothetical protein
LKPVALKWTRTPGEATGGHALPLAAAATEATPKLSPTIVSISNMRIAKDRYIQVSLPFSWRR